MGLDRLDTFGIIHRDQLALMWHQNQSHAQCHHAQIHAEMRAVQTMNARRDQPFWIAQDGVLDAMCLIAASMWDGLGQRRQWLAAQRAWARRHVISRVDASGRRAIRQ